jgi:hypothetical protein
MGLPHTARKFKRGVSSELPDNATLKISRQLNLWVDEEKKGM